MASDKRLDVVCISSTVPFKIVLQGLTVDFEKSQVLACLVSQGAGKTTTLLSF